MNDERDVAQILVERDNVIKERDALKDRVREAEAEARKVPSLQRRIKQI